MIDSILDKLDSLGDQHPHKLLYSYIDLNGNPIGGYSYEEFLHRTKVIAVHLRRVHGFESQERLLLAYPPGLEMICAFFGCVRAGLIPVPVPNEPEKLEIELSVFPWASAAWNISLDE